MKKIFLLLFVLMFVASTASAATKAKAKKKVVKKVVVEESGPSNARWVFQAQGGPDFMLSGTGYPMGATVVSPGWGYDVSAGYAFSDLFSLSLLYGYHVSAISIPDAPASVGMSVSYIPLQLVPQITAPGDELKFFGFCGIGLAFNTLSMTMTADNEPVDGVGYFINIGGRNLSFLLSPGVGLGIKLTNNLDLTIQTKMVMDFVGSTIADALSEMSSDPEKKFDGVQIMVPINVGLSFSTL